MSLFSRIQHRISSFVASAAKTEEVLTRLAHIEEKLKYQEHFSRGSEATYVGNNRVLAKIVVAGNRLAFLLEADDRLLSPWLIVSGGYETMLTDYFVGTLQMDSHCLDIGANFGYFTCLMARFCTAGLVVGVEPDEHVFALARDNVFINGFQDRASIVHAAAAAEDATITLHRRGTRSANTSITKVGEDYTRAMAEPPSQAFEVTSVRVDSLLAKMGGRIDFMKIDVEGAEPLVFEGARETIAVNPQLSIVVEWSPGQIVGAGFEIVPFLSTIEAMGLRPFDIAEGGALMPLAFSDLPNIAYRAGIVLKRA